MVHFDNFHLHQGIKVTVDIFDGFGGFASSFITRIRDELTKVPILTFGMDEPIKKDHSNVRFIMNDFILFIL